MEIMLIVVMNETSQLCFQKLYIHMATREDWYVSCRTSEIKVESERNEEG